MSEKLNEVLDEFISTPVLINLYKQDSTPILNLGNQKEIHSFKEFDKFREYLDLDYNGLIILINSNENFKLEEVEEIGKLLEVKYCRRFIIGAKIDESSETLYRVIAIKNTSNNKRFAQENYLARTKELIQQLEDPLAEIEDVMIKLKDLDLSTEQEKRILERLKYIGEIFEPRKGKIKTL